jgi:AbrB family looped-hinge helix DNA binding protein
MSLTRVNHRGQITIPKKFREILHCNKGDYVEVILDENTLRIIPKQLIDKSQTWFWTKEHQEEEAEAEMELLQGKGKQAESARNLIDELNK